MIYHTNNNNSIYGSIIIIMIINEFRIISRDWRLTCFTTLHYLERDYEAPHLKLCYYYSFLCQYY